MTTTTSVLGSRAIIGRFYNTLEQTIPPAWMTELALPVSSNQESETYKWLGMTPTMREWIAGRQATGFRVNGQTVTNKLYEATLKVQVDDMRRDKTGQIMARVDDLAARAALFPTKLMSDLILAGETTNCYDGQYFFDTDHSEGSSGTQSNDIAYDISDNGTGGTATAPTPYTVQGAIVAAIAAIMGFKDDQGEPMNETAARFHVMVPVPYMGATLAALTSSTLGDRVDNLLVNRNIGLSVIPAVNPRLTWTTKLAVFRADGGVKPFILQEEQEAMMDAVAEGSELEFQQREHHYGVTRICAAAYGYWQHACLVTLQA